MNEIPTQVLLIEDNPGDATLVKAMLSEDSQKFAVTWARSLAEGVPKLGNGRDGPNVVLLDVNLPDATGMEGLQQVLHQAPDLPVVVMTGHEDESFGVEAVKQGAQDYLRKGFADGTLIARALNYAIERKRAESKLRLASTVFEAASDGIMVVDATYRITAVNPSYRALTGYEESQLLGTEPSFLFSQDNDPDLSETIDKELDRGRGWSGEVVCRRRDESTFTGMLSANSVLDAEGNRTAAVFVLRDITARKEAERTIWNQANYDSLTELPNRTLFVDRLSAAMARARRSNGKLAVAFIDLDRFKWVNDTLGHDAGDILLKTAAERLTRSTRASDTVGRFGGDEFVILLDSVGGEHHPDKAARKILSELARPFDLNGTEVSISGSIGMTYFPDDAGTVQELLKNADTAMYEAKEAGRNAYRFFTPQMNIEAQEKIRLESDLRHALANDTLSLWYQPVIDLPRSQIATVEALLRWEDPERGMVPPSDFVPLAEETGLITKIGYWVLETACNQIRDWRNSGAPSFRVAVNLSPRQFREDRFADQLLQIISLTGADPTWLTLDINEGLFQENSREIDDTVRRLRSEGVQISLDDFGTGYSSLGYLRRLAVDILKIDRSIVARMMSDNSDANLVETIVAVGKTMGATIIAEGVETKEQLAMLTSHGCDLAQGYFFGRPVRAEDLLAECERGLQHAREVLPQD